MLYGISGPTFCFGLGEGVRCAQEFVELVRQERMLDAIAYSRQHLSPWSDLYQADLQRALAALAFRAGAFRTFIGKLTFCCKPC